MNIPFNKPHLAGKEIFYIRDAHRRRQLAGDGFYTKLITLFAAMRSTSLP